MQFEDFREGKDPGLTFKVKGDQLLVGVDWAGPDRLQDFVVLVEKLRSGELAAPVAEAIEAEAVLRDGAIAESLCDALLGVGVPVVDPCEMIPRLLGGLR